ncbi:MAG: hypothetical protein JHC95_18835 [Solirubrobacteraceae bacterium]|nr:hypothetical protein [Solirubrobacteraceae bacterium]
MAVVLASTSYDEGWWILDFDPVLTAWAAVEGRDRQRGDGIMVLVAPEGLAEIRLRSATGPGRGPDWGWRFSRRGDRLVGGPGPDGAGAGSPGPGVAGVQPLLAARDIVGGVVIGPDVPLTPVIAAEASPTDLAAVQQPHVDRLTRDWFQRHGSGDDLAALREAGRGDGRALMDVSDRLGALTWSFREETPEFAFNQELSMQYELAALSLLGYD